MGESLLLPRIFIHGASDKTRTRHRFDGAAGLNELSFLCDFTAQEPSRFSSTTSGHVLGKLAFQDLASSPHSAQRTAGRIQEVPRQLLLVVLVNNGEASVTQDGRSATIGAGRLAFLRSDAEFTLTTLVVSRMVTLAIPLGLLLADGSRVTSMTARVLDDTPILAALTDLIGRFGLGERPEVETIDELASHALIDLARATIQSQSLRVTGFADVEDDLRSRIRDHIDHNLFDPNLTAQSIATALTVSLRYVYRLFEDEDTTIAKAIRERRIARIGAMLAESPKSFVQLARESGFKNTETARRAFHLQFGQSPQEFRSARR